MNDENVLNDLSDNEQINNNIVSEENDNDSNEDFESSKNIVNEDYLKNSIYTDDFVEDILGEKNY